MSANNSTRAIGVGFMALIILGLAAIWIAKPLANHAQQQARQRWGIAQAGFVDEVLPSYYAGQIIARVCYPVSNKANICTGRVMKDSYKLHNHVTFWQDKKGYIFVRNSLNENNGKWLSAPWPWTQKYYIFAAIIAVILSYLYAAIHVRWIMPHEPDNSLETLPFESGTIKDSPV